jgi:hypothetical protein
MAALRERTPAEWTGLGQLLFGAGLIAFGARRGGLLGLVACVSGIERLSPFALGGASLSQVLRSAARSSAPDPQRFGDGTRDCVDEASWESFPASDPPGRGVG